MRKILNLLASSLRIISIIALVIMVFVIVLQVAARYVLRTPVGWTEEVAIATMVWITFFGSFLAFNDKKHMRITLLFNTASPVCQRVMLLLGNTLVMVLNGYIVYYGLRYAVAFQRLRSPYLGIPMYYQYMIIPLAAGLWFLYLLIENIEILRNTDYWKYQADQIGPSPAKADAEVPETNGA